MVDVERYTSRSPSKLSPRQPKATTVVITTDHRVKTIPSVFPSPSHRLPQTAGQIHVVESTQIFTAKDVCSWIRMQESPPVHRFIQAHRRDDGILQRRLYEEKVNVFLASWWRFAVQEGDQRRIQKKIDAKKKPYDIDTVKDPLHLHLSHQRYEIPPESPHRPPYHFMSFSDDGKMVHNAAQECMSWFSGDIDGVPTGEYLVSNLYQPLSIC